MATFEAAAATSGFLYGEYARWPDKIPADIPVLEGKIQGVMEAPGSHIRIIYSSVSEQVVSQYLAQLEAEGFQMEYNFYVQEGFPDTSAERIARGEWDAVDITKGPYHMRLEPGGGQATYDIYTAGFTTPDPRTLMTATPIAWPDDIPARVLPPANCEINSLARLGTGGYQIAFRCSDDLVLTHFVDSLRAAGLAETGRLENEFGEIVDITLQDKEVAVKAMAAFNGSFTIQVWPVAPSPPEACGVCRRVVTLDTSSSPA